MQAGGHHDTRVQHCRYTHGSGLADALVEAAYDNLFPKMAPDDGLRTAWRRLKEGRQFSFHTPAAQVIREAQLLLADQLADAAGRRKMAVAAARTREPEDRADRYEPGRDRNRDRSRPSGRDAPRERDGRRYPPGPPTEERGSRRETAFQGVRYCANWAQAARENGLARFRCPRDNCQFAPCSRGGTAPPDAVAYFARRRN